MKKWILILCIILSGGGLFGCASVGVTVNYNKDINFSQYKTYRFVQPKFRRQRRAEIKNPLFTKDVMREIRPIMENKGFVEASSTEGADLLVHFYAMIRERRNFSPPTYRVGRWGRTWVAQPGRVVQYKEGTLGIDIVDRRRKELIWQGVGKGVLDRQNPAKNLVQAVEKVLEPFPPLK